MPVITFEELKNKYQTKLTKEAEVSCKLLAKLKDGYLVDVNNEWEGFVPLSHISNLGNDISCQEPFQALIISGPDKSERYTVSPKALNEKLAYEKLEKIKEEDKSLKVTISRVVKGGVEVFIDNVRAFLPGRYIRLPGINQDNWIGQEIEVLIEEINYKEKKIILNHKKAIDLDRKKRAEVVIQKLNEGDIVEAPVLRIADFGVFVDLGGLDGLIPASELSWGRFTHPREILKVGQVVQARIFRIERENLRVALSIKQLLGDPWEQINNELDIGQLVTGKVISEASFGLFLQLRPGVEALIHNSEIPENIEKPKVGASITTKVIKIDADQRKIGLSLRDVKHSEDSPPETGLTRAEGQLPEVKEQMTEIRTESTEEINNLALDSTPESNTPNSIETTEKNTQSSMQETQE